MKQKKFPQIVDDFMSYLTPHGPITVRAMFGGYGIFYDGVIFASVIENELYFRVDEESREEFEKRGSKQFVYEGMGRPVGMPYFTIPAAILKNKKELKRWIDRAYLASMTSKKKKKK